MLQVGHGSQTKRLEDVASLKAQMATNQTQIESQERQIKSLQKQMAVGLLAKGARDPKSVSGLIGTESEMEWAEGLRGGRLAFRWLTKDTIKDAHAFDAIADCDYYDCCRDLIDDCAIHQGNGGCLDANDQHAYWRTQCGRTCEYCGYPRHDDRYQDFSWFYYYSGSHREITSAGKCQDRISSCDIHMANGGCSDANSINYYWRTACVKTCGYCAERHYGR